MATIIWQTEKTRFCDHAGCEVGLEVEAVYPSESLPDQPARLGAHRCSHGEVCALNNQATCVWAGTNPTYDPFSEK